MPRRSRAGWASLIGMVLGCALVAMGVYKTANTRSDHYWPLLFIGLTFGIFSTPFYYYFKAQDKQPFDAQHEAVEALAVAGKNAAKEHQQQRERIKKDNN
ncbi:MAG TPA: hypothetical protein VG992_03480 [Candidatus Saccharimonadales bacterium]|nr:hypothetical protein [Candidatus Saccharimonadales bacterium]